MKLSAKRIRELAKLSETDRTVLSAYLDFTNGWEAVKQFIERETSRLIPVLSEEERDYFETSLSFLLDDLKKRRRQGFHGPGLAFFADLGANFLRDIELPSPPEALLAVDDEAIIHPLALQLDEFEPIGVIMIDAHCIRILIAAGQVIERLNSIREKIHHLSKVGGWSQMRYQRRRAKEVQYFTKEALEKGLEMFQEAGVQRIVIGGRDRMVTALEQDFPKAWQDKVIATVRWDLDAPDDEFLSKIKPFLEKTERDQEKDLLQRLVGELRRQGLAVAGVMDTRQALKRGQVDTLLISGELDPVVSEELTSLAEATGAAVEFFPQDNEQLARLGNVGALLRYKL